MADGEYPTAELAKKRSVRVNKFEWSNVWIARGGVGLLIALTLGGSLFSAAPALAA